MILLQLLQGITYQKISMPSKMELREIKGIEADSRKVKPDYAYVCIEGYETDGHRYILDAIEQGAIVIVVQNNKVDTDGLDNVVCIEVENTRYTLALLATNFYSHPAQKLKTIGITGTKGKTTCTYMIHAILEHAGYQVGLIGTIEIRIGTKSRKSNHTTPDALELQRTLAEMVEAGCEVVVMEVSSQGLKLDRVAGVIFDIGVFTNLGEDHIGATEHVDVEEYLACKAKLFQQCKLGIGNVDDNSFKEMFQYATCEMMTYGIHQQGDVQAVNIERFMLGKHMGIRYEVVQNRHLDEKDLAENFLIEMMLPGIFNIYNSLAAITACSFVGVGKLCIQETMKTVQIKGRMERIETPYAFTLLIDYSHNAMSLEQALLTLRAYHPSKLIVIFGCGGNRAKNRRYEMGEVAGRLADFTIITSDNPRYEQPEDILDDIETGISQTDGKYIRIVDRKEAIRYGMNYADEGDVIILAGKGHENYQEIKGIKYEMDERMLIQDIIENEDKNK